MPDFRHKSLDTSGRETAGVIGAADRKDALRQLAARGLQALELREAGTTDETEAPLRKKTGTTPSLGKRPLFGTHPAALRFTAKLEQLTAGGLPAGDAVRLLAARTGEPVLKLLSKSLWADLSEGRTLAEAMGRFPDVFESGTRGLVEAGESTGTLGPALRRVMEFQRTREELRKKLTAALAYPTLVCGLAGITIALFVFHLLPRLEGMMRSLNAEFSGASFALILIAKATVYGLPVAALAVFVIAARIRLMRRTPEGRRRSDALLLRLPLAGGIIRHAETAGFAGLLGTLLGSGVNATESLRLTEKTVANAGLRTAFTDARTRINEGAAFSAAFRRTGLLDEAELDIVLVNESTGTLDRAFEEISRGRLAALDDALKHLVRVLSGFFLTAAFVIVFFCLLSVMLSVLQVSRSILG